MRSVADASKTEFAITGKTTYVDLDGPALPKKYEDALRDIVVYATSELLDWADTPILDPVSGASLTLDAQVDGLTSGHLLMASGADADTGEPRSEAVTLARTRAARWTDQAGVHDRTPASLPARVPDDLRECRARDAWRDEDGDSWQRQRVPGLSEVRASSRRP